SSSRMYLNSVELMLDAASRRVIALAWGYQFLVPRLYGTVRSRKLSFASVDLLWSLDVPVRSQRSTDWEDVMTARQTVLLIAAAGAAVAFITPALSQTIPQTPAEVARPGGTIPGNPKLSL